MKQGSRAVAFSRFSRHSPLLFSALFCLEAGSVSSEPLFVPDTVQTHIETDGSLVGSGRVIGPDSGDVNRYTIGSNDGLLVGADSTGAGGNLFYSFGQFDLADVDTAVFSAASETANLSPKVLLVRVTQGLPSYLYGSVESEFSDTDLYFANRAGILVGPSGNFDISGLSDSAGSSFISSADRLIFDDGYFATGGDGPAFHSNVQGLECCGGDPNGFGFDYGGTGEVLFNGGFHEWRGEGILQIVASNIRLIGGGKFVNKGGEIHLAAVGDAALTVPVALTGDANFSGGVLPNGVIELLRVPGDGGTADLSTSGGTTSYGRVVLRAGRLVLEGASIKAGGRDGSEATIDVEASESISLEGSSIFALQTFESSPADHTGIRLSAPDIRLGEAVIGAPGGPGGGGGAVLRGSSLVSTSGSESAGRIEVLASGSLVLEGSNTRISTALSDAPAGGDVRIATGTLELHDGAEILTTRKARRNPTGPTGNVGIVAQEVLLQNGSSIGSRTESLSPGGSVSLDVGDQLAVLDASEIYTESVGDPSSVTGDVGDVVISAGEIVLENGSNIRSTTRTAARGGDVELVARRSVSLSTLSAIASEPRGFGDAGDIRIETGSLLVDGGSQIISQNNPELSFDDQGNLVKNPSLELGAPGNIEVVATGLLVIDGVYGDDIETAIRSMISTRVENPGSEADAGAIAITAGSVEIKNGALVTSRISSDPRAGKGRAGSIVVRATDSFRLTGRAPLPVDEFGRTLNSEISARSSGAAAGDITLTASSIEISDGAGVAATSFGSSRAGSIRIGAGEEILLVDSRVTAEAGRADGGNISLDAGGLIELVDSLIETEVLSEQGGAGEIMVGQQMEPDLVLLNSSSLISNAAQGGAGDISISGGRLVRSADTVVQAASDNAQLDGEISIDALEEELTGRLVPLEIAYLDVNSVLLPPCAARLEADRSSLTVGGRPSMASEPGGLLPSPILSARTDAGSATDSSARGQRAKRVLGEAGRAAFSLGPGLAQAGAVGVVSCGVDWPWPVGL